MADKFLRQNGGLLEEVNPLEQSAGAADSGRIPMTGADGKLHESFLPAGMGDVNRIVPAYENLAAGDYVNLFSDAGAVKARKADASTTGKGANGYVTAAALAGNNCTVYGEGVNAQLVGLTPGITYFLSDTTPGGVVNAPPVGAGKVVQPLGVSLSVTELLFQPGQAIKLA